MFLCVLTKFGKNKIMPFSHQFPVSTIPFGEILIDAKVETADTIYILEFKLDKSGEEALAQIREKEYFKAYQDSPKKKVGVGINFSVAKKGSRRLRRGGVLVSFIAMQLRIAIALLL